MTASARRCPTLSWRVTALCAMTLALVAGNVWIAAHRMEGYNYRLASYARIYEPLEQPAAESVRWTSPDRLDVEVTGAPIGRWTLRRRSAVEPPARSTAALAPGATAGSTRVTLTGEPASYALVPVDGDPRGERTFRVGPRQRLFASSDLLVGPRDARSSIHDLTYSPDDYPAQDVAEARALLQAAGIGPSASTEERLRRVWLLVFQALDGHRGTPPPWLNRLPVLEQYRRLVKGEVRSHCNTFAGIFALFATAAGVPTRVVDTNRVLNGVDLSAHTFAEVYLPETGRWAYSDVTLGVAFVRDGRSGRTLDAVQLSGLLQAGATGGLVATVERGGRLVDVAFDDLPGRDFVAAYLNHNATFVYHRRYADRGAARAWLHRYLIAPELAYSLHGDNRKHWTKLACFYMLLLQTAVWVGLAGRWCWARRRGPGPVDPVGPVGPVAPVAVGPAAVAPTAGGFTPP